MFPRWLVGLFFTAGIASASPELSSIAFQAGNHQFRNGDSIVIDQVLATSPQLEVGTRLVVRGHYRLASAVKARLGLLLTHRSALDAEADTSESSQMTSIVKANGSFELSGKVTYEGDPHVSFYSAAGGEAFGGVYFSGVPVTSAVKPELPAIPFVVGQQQFKTGDSIVIDQVLATSPRLDVGTKLVVRGHYRLASANQAGLGLFLTHRSQSRSGSDVSAQSQIASTVGADGSFELSCDITYEGNPHVSFYPAEGGEALGGVYFSGMPRKS